MVVALSGWVDAGVAGEGAIHALLEQCTDSGRLCDAGSDRPARSPTDATDRVSSRAGCESSTGRTCSSSPGRAGCDIVVRGPEPSLRWRGRRRDRRGRAPFLGVIDAVTLGGMPALVAPPVASRARDRDDPLPRTGIGAVAPRLRGTDGHADDRAACARCGRDPVRRPVGPRHRSTSPAHRRHPRCARCSRKPRRGPPSRFAPARPRHADRRVPEPRRGGTVYAARCERDRRPPRPRAVTASRATSSWTRSNASCVPNPRSSCCDVQPGADRRLGHYE